MQVYFADPAAFEDAFLTRVMTLLPPEKQCSIAKIKHIPTRRQATLAWALLVYTMKLQMPDEPLPPLGFTESGKPFFPDSNVYFNLSHTDTLVCVALSGQPVGVDAQTLTTPSDGVVKRVLTSAEQELFNAAEDKAAVFTVLWTQKEAFVKRTGEGIAYGLRSLDFAPYSGFDRFMAYDCCFSVFRLCGAVMTACGTEVKTPRQVTQQMLEKKLLLSNDS